ncbi:hypothetical protein XMM379_002055 [Aliiroseovarius sp. xm-m-379]|uniref:DUF2189 domain-containing protein n=1 Tax=unclassified Aliiroseovarius TaxID=2623558 RepID=UPI001568DFDE|nr:MULTISPECIES: DUF2189 domain-containing protein [unclassified Aliiroseovarius]NRP12131.1 hypothetical protein [Aliiroseovarius sp. xm-d-517]NRP25359.1 hypothetical protein [Aliiroseovarius sp. xm-m-379]NRP30913.1 hypothetical protein [Aliiroseovarius sp. xm-m-314]NRP34158.1 hypothetical protein [Aliiroseovarius sp. xm-a-104]NRP41375.1 hypothetical protein [Aliiroseovarius sp. xm-m-339-2]
MTDATELEASAPPTINQITISDVMAALRNGWTDFRRAPAFGLFFALFYVLGGIVLYLEFEVMGQSYWIIPVAFGFPFLAPFLAVGLYEVSRRLEQGGELDWAQILGSVVNQKDRQFPSIAMVLIMGFLFWIFVAHIVFMLFMGLQPMTNITSNWQDALLNRNGISMLAVGTLVGGAMAFVAFSITVCSLPMLLDREMDFISAMIHSFQAVMQNLVPMIFWGGIVTVITILGMLPLFFGLFIALPVLGHATWHLYRRTMSFEG